MAAKHNHQVPDPCQEKLPPRDEAYLKASKEIAVKFIETGRLSLASFNEAFGQIYRTIKETVEE